MPINMLIDVNDQTSVPGAYVGKARMIVQIAEAHAAAIQPVAENLKHLEDCVKITWNIMDHDSPIQVQDYQTMKRRIRMLKDELSRIEFDSAEKMTSYMVDMGKTVA